MPEKLKDKGSYFSGTQYVLNAFEDQRNNAARSGWEVTGQLEECPKTKRLHYQFMVHVPGQQRVAAVRKMFPGAHIEVAHKPAALAQYVVKEETRVGALPPASDNFPSLQKFYKLIVDALISADDEYRLDVATAWFKGYAWYKGDEEEFLLSALDEATRILILKGFHVETLAVNPQTRSAWKKFGRQILRRSFEEIASQTSVVDRQTDRQAEILSQPSTITEDAGSDDAESASGSADESQVEEAQYEEDEAPEIDFEDYCSDDGRFSSGGETDCTASRGDDVQARTHIRFDR